MGLVGAIRLVLGVEILLVHVCEVREGRGVHITYLVIGVRVIVRVKRKVGLFFFHHMLPPSLHESTLSPGSLLLLLLHHLLPFLLHNSLFRLVSHPRSRTFIYFCQIP